MTAPFLPRHRVSALGARATKAVEAVAAGLPWKPETLYTAAKNLEATRPRLAKRLHDLGAVWAVLHREVRDAS